MTRAAVPIDDLPNDVRKQVRKRLKPDRDSLTRAAVAVLAALDQNGLAVSQWLKVLELVRKWLKS